MALLGQASGGFTESSSALRILHVGVRNTLGQLTADCFTQTNPPVVSTNVTDAPGLLTSVLGVLSGSVAFARGTAASGGGKNFHGGPTDAAVLAEAEQRPLGVFINNASGNAFENTPGVASNRGPYVSAQGSYANRLYETKNLDSGAALTYAVGERLVASMNGYLTNQFNIAANDHAHAGQHNVNGGSTVIAILKITPDSTSDELVYDQRV